MTDSAAPGNRPDRLQWFNDLGFGLLIHWSVDSQVGSVIGHTLAGASKDYFSKFTELLPSTFNPKSFDPSAWATLAKLAGIRYVVFTTKHHSGFCMFHTETTSFGVANTPFARDITGEIIGAFREQDIAIGLYFSPDDFYFLNQKGRPMHRGVKPDECEGLLDHNRAQLTELLTNYGKIDLLFFDGPSDGLRELCWETDPEIVVTRGAISTPEQRIPGVQGEEPWEACVTMGTAWQYKPTNEQYKTGTKLIELLIETRAKGGNLSLNIGPKPNGELAIEQEALLREIALWNLVNGESIYAVKPWRVPSEGDVWFTAAKRNDTVYAFVQNDTPWPLRERRELELASVRVEAGATVRILGQSESLMDGERPAVEWSQEGDVLRISATRMQRLYNNKRWPNPVVLEITMARIGLVPPTLITDAVVCDATESSALLQGRLTDLGEGNTVEAGFQYRLSRLLTEAPDEWRDTDRVDLDAAGEVSARIDGLEAGTRYEFRVIGRQKGLTVYGDHVVFTAA